MINKEALGFFLAMVLFVIATIIFSFTEFAWVSYLTAGCALVCGVAGSAETLTGSRDA